MSEELEELIESLTLAQAQLCLIKLAREGCTVNEAASWAKYAEVG